MTIRTDTEAVYSIICDRCQAEELNISSWNPLGWPPELKIFGPRSEDYIAPQVWDGQLCADCTKQLLLFLADAVNPK